MSILEQLKRALPAAGAVVGGLLFSMFGKCTTLLHALFAFMVADYVSGVLLAAIFKRSGKTESGALSSKAGFLGLARKGGMLLMVLIANQLDAVLNVDYIKGSVCMFLLANEGISILENLGLMGVPFPDVLRTALDALSKQSKSGED